jgi:cbb3-type cytochrome oxidase subunit 3
MNAVPITLTISLSLVFIFVAFYLREHARSRLGSYERDSLLPLDEEKARVVADPKSPSGRR